MNRSLLKSPQGGQSSLKNDLSSSAKSVTNIIKTIPKFFLKGSFNVILGVFKLIASAIFTLIFLVSGR
jgi:hypothetical protein